MENNTTHVHYEVWLGRNDGNSVHLGTASSEERKNHFIQTICDTINKHFKGFEYTGVIDGVGPHHCCIVDGGKKVWFTLVVKEIGFNENLENELINNINEMITWQKMADAVREQQLQEAAEKVKEDSTIYHIQVKNSNKKD